ncbi:hypothetical protein GCM10010520_12990 [Rhizobium viscosum]|uniref:GNAT family N-acetyltransferase n=2 Tax=Rhizobium viscosum TaxID=1673 RepID=A0ABR9IY45_RHIVS|nr:hypothetical protein [Rhizobium viscosum]
MVNKYPNLRCQVATTPDHVRDAMILRSICFVHEHGISPSFIFDGNDHQATHFVFYDGEDPVGSLRIRWFADFAKYERTCFREKYRHPFTVKRCIQMTFDHVARKGYTKVLTQAEQRLARLWTILFDLEIVDSPPVEIAGHPEPYLTVVGTIPASSDPITMESSSALLLRVEGQWDAPSSFETA